MHGPTVPPVSDAATPPASLRARTARLAGGLGIIAVGVALMVRARLGLAPYEVLHEGLAARTPLTIGQASVATGLLVLLLWIPLHQRPGVGTVANVIGVGLMLDGWLLVLPAPGGMLARSAMLIGGVLFVGIGIGAYLSAGLGAGPRDGVMTGLAARGYRVWAVRLTLELSALLVGWALGGTVGVGTVLFAVAVPFLAHGSLRRWALPDDLATPAGIATEAPGLTRRDAVRRRR